MLELCPPETPLIRERPVVLAAFPSSPYAAWMTGSDSVRRRRTARRNRRNLRNSLVVAARTHLQGGASSVLARHQSGEQVVERRERLLERHRLRGLGTG